MWNAMENVPLLSYQKKLYTTGPDGLIVYHEADLEEAMALAGVGKYQTVHCIVMVATLSAALLEIIGPAYVLPAAACDLKISGDLMGVLTSIPNLGIVLTAPLWGRVADAWGRKPVLLLCTGVTGAFSFASAFSKTLASYVICKTTAALFLSCPSSLSWAYISEMYPKNRRDSTVLICNAFLMMSSVMIPVIAWLIFSHEVHSADGSVQLKPWRSLAAIYAFPMLLISLCLTRVDESPKFLMSRGRRRCALDVVKRIYSVNSGQFKERFSVTSIRFEGSEQHLDSMTKVREGSALALLQKPHLKWLVLTGFLMFGLFTALNGLFLFAPQLINKAFSVAASHDKGTICALVNKPLNLTVTTPTCTDTISEETFHVVVMSTLIYSMVAMAASFSAVDKRTQLSTLYTIVGMACLFAVLQRNKMVAGFAMSALQLLALGIGALTAYTVHLFPTSLRGTAVGAVLMFGRMGAAVGANTAGLFLNIDCGKTFYGFAALLFLCAGLTSLLPKTHNSTHLTDY